eukprot:scaffold30759_cov62-Phaeocystis_antarctica.AAC.3
MTRARSEVRALLVITFARSMFSLGRHHSANGRKGVPCQHGALWKFLELSDTPGRVDVLNHKCSQCSPPTPTCPSSASMARSHSASSSSSTIPSWVVARAAPGPSTPSASSASSTAPCSTCPRSKRPASSRWGLDPSPQPNLNPIPHPNPGFIKAAADGAFADASGAAAGDLVLMVRSSTPSYTGFQVSFASGTIAPPYACAGGGAILVITLTSPSPGPSPLTTHLSP